LWTVADYPNDPNLVESVQPIVSEVLPKLNPQTVFFPLLKATQPRFEAAHCRLWAGEAVAIAKLMTFVLAQGAPAAAEAEPAHWYTKLCRVVAEHPRAADSPEQLVTEHLFPDLVYDAVMLGFNLLSDRISEQFGSKDEMAAYANQLVTSLTGKGDPLDITHIYLPLVLAGLVVNMRITLPQEKSRETVSLIADAREKRTAEEDSSNKFIFDLLDDLIQRVLEDF